MEKLATIKIKKNSHKKLIALRGYRGCITIDDVINYLLKNQKPQKQEK